WSADPTLPGPRRVRASFQYRAYVPDPIAPKRFDFSGPVAEAVARAERAVSDLNRNPPALAPLEVLARRLLRSEAVASSRIEGLELSQRRLARAEAIGDDSRDETARSVLANVAAMDRAIVISGKRGPLKSRDIDAIHKALMEG